MKTARTAWARVRTALKWTLVALAAAVVFAAAALWVLLHRPIPPRAGDVALAGLSRDAEVRFDARAVPHVRAATEADAYRALGFLHAQDRLFQMELRRRAAQGRLAEVFGEALVGFDTESRFADHVALAQRDFALLPAATRALLDAYAGGVNAFIADGPRPFELVVLGIRPEPWTAVDSLSFARFMLAGLSEAPDRERGILEQEGKFGGADGIVTLPGAAAPEPGSRGSNAWAIAGSRTRGGFPILANDPHLQLEVPGVWYAAHLTSEDGLDVAGLTLAGAPGVVIGHNGRVAWGITMAQLDDADVLLEPVDVAKREVSAVAGWTPLRTRVETIRIRGGEERALTLYSTSAGRILGVSPGPGDLRTAATLEFAPDAAPQSLTAFLRAARASDAASIESAWGAYGGPAVNLCWASRDGHIGLRLAGAIPKRASSALSSAWQGRVEDALLPRIVDPPEGFVASANDDWSASSRPLPFAGFFASDDRVRRMRAMLAASSTWTAADANALQNDVVSNYALRLLARMGDFTPRTDGAAQALALLRGWSGAVERTGPSRLFHAFAAAVAARLHVTQWAALDAAFDERTNGWDDPATPKVEAREDVLDAALAESYAAVVRAEGDAPARWSWAAIHRIRFAHAFSALLPFDFLKDRLDVGPIGMPGDTHTLNVEAFRIGREPWIRHMPSARIVVDLGDPDASTLVLPLGESAHRLDSHYSDQVDAWASGTTFPLPFGIDAVNRQTVSALRLRAADPQRK